MNYWSIIASLQGNADLLAAARRADCPWDLRCPFTTTQGIGAWISYTPGSPTDAYVANDGLNFAIAQLGLSPLTQEGLWGIYLHGLDRFCDVILPLVLDWQFDHLAALGRIVRGQPFLAILDAEGPGTMYGDLDQSGAWAYFRDRAMSTLGMSLDQARALYIAVRKRVLSAHVTVGKALEPQSKWGCYGGHCTNSEVLVNQTATAATEARTFAGVSPTQMMDQELRRQNDELGPALAFVDVLVQLSYHNFSASVAAAATLRAGEYYAPTISHHFELKAAESCRVALALGKPWISIVQTTYEGSNAVGIKLRGIRSADRQANVRWDAYYGCSGRVTWDRHDHTAAPNDHPAGFVPVDTAADVLAQMLSGLAEAQRQYIVYERLAEQRRAVLGIPTFRLAA